MGNSRHYRVRRATARARPAHLDDETLGSPPAPWGPLGEIDAYGRIARGLGRSDRRWVRVTGRTVVVVMLVFFLGMPVIGLVRLIAG
jgi:hypothetical protein